MPDLRAAVLASSTQPDRWRHLDDELRRRLRELAAREMRQESLQRAPTPPNERDELHREAGDPALPERRASMASPEAIDAFRQEFPRTRLWLVPPLPPTAVSLPVGGYDGHDEREALQQLMDELGPPPGVGDEEGALAEVAHLEKAAHGKHRCLWRALSPSTQLLFIEYFAARLRTTLTFRKFDNRSEHLIQTLREHLQTERPGIARGVARLHQPRGASWHSDAALLFRQIGALLAPPVAPAVSAPRRPRERDGAASPAAPRPHPFEGWEHSARFRGKSVLILGGGGRHTDESGESLRADLGLAALEWIDVDGKLRQLESVGARVVAGAFAFVFVTKFCSHTQSDLIIDSCRRAAVPYAVLRHGHGAQAVKSAVERSLGQ